MHSLSFQLKRAHHRVVAFGKSVLRRFGLTPARFDLLFVVYARWTFRKRVYDAPAQMELCRVLGVTAATVSRMVRSLEELGIVTRFRNPVDHRTKQVSLTKEGLDVFHEALEYVLGTRVVDVAYRRAFAPHYEGFELAVAVLKHRVETVAKAFGDTSSFTYECAWKWDDERRTPRPRSGTIV